MDSADIFRSVLPRQPLPQLQPHPQHPYYGRLIPALPLQTVPRRLPPPNRFDFQSHDADTRIAHTLTACCRCRQRKTRCDPTLPRCLPCERSGSICEYYDTTRRIKISRGYVVQLQDRVRALTAELSQYTEDDGPDPYDGFMRGNGIGEGFMRPGEMVRLNDGGDETPRYLGPSSGIAMTRVLMEAAKRYTDSKSIAELFPDVKDRRPRVPSVIMGGTVVPPEKRRSFPMISDVAADSLPTRVIADGLLEIFNQRGQAFWPTLHEKILVENLEAVYAGDTDAHKNFIVRMVFAISLQKLDTQYAGLADSYYLAATMYFEDVIRAKDLKTLQCLLLIGQYSLLTPTRTAVYFVIGLATRICQQLGFADEKTIGNGYGGVKVDPLTLDMRRRVFWTMTAMEMGLAHTMGRPSGFAKGDDAVDVEFFSTLGDEHITKEGLLPGPVCERKLFAIHLYKMRLRQADIRRILYEQKLPEPRNENHPWYGSMVHSIQKWYDEAPTEPAWSRPWFTGRFHQLRIFLYRPSPQLPIPSANAALHCFESAAVIVDLSKKQVEQAAVDITWVFLLVLYMALNTLLWTVSSYNAVRSAHSREKVENMIQVAIEILDQCADRWPGTRAAAQLYRIFANACLQSYESNENMVGNSWHTPPSEFESASSPIKLEMSMSPLPNSQHLPYDQHQQQQQQHQQQQQMQGIFGGNSQPYRYMFDGQQDPTSALSMNFSFDQDVFGRPGPQDTGPTGVSGGDGGCGNLGNGNGNGNGHNGQAGSSQPTFRSNSIFFNPATTNGTGRRFSFFPPEFSSVSDMEHSHDPTPPTSLQSINHQHHNIYHSQHDRQPHQSQHRQNNMPPSNTGPENNLESMGGDSSHTQMPLPTLDEVSTPLMAVSSPIHMPNSPDDATSPTVAATSPNRHMHSESGAATFVLPPQQIQAHEQLSIPQQRPLPSGPVNNTMDWFAPPPQYASPYNFNTPQNQLLDPSETQHSTNNSSTPASLNLMQLPYGGHEGFMHLGLPPAVSSQFASEFGIGGLPVRQGSLTPQQVLELMGLLEDNGQSEIDTLLGMGMGFGGGAVNDGMGADWQ